MPFCRIAQTMVHARTWIALEYSSPMEAVSAQLLHPVTSTLVVAQHDIRVQFNELMATAYDFKCSSVRHSTKRKSDAKGNARAHTSPVLL